MDDRYEVQRLGVLEARMNDGSGGHRQESRMTVFDLVWKYQFPKTVTPV